MTRLNLVVKFQLIGDRQVHVKAAARMKLDGYGGLMLYGTDSELAEKIELRNLLWFRLHSVTQSCVAPAA